MPCAGNRDRCAAQQKRQRARPTVCRGGDTLIQVLSSPIWSGLELGMDTESFVFECRTPFLRVRERFCKPLGVIAVVVSG